MTKKEVRLFGQEVAKFGRWQVTKKGILFNTVKSFLFIQKEKLFEIRQDKQLDKWDLPLDIASKKWVSDSDMYKFIAAFFFAQDFFKNDRPEENKRVSVHRTLQAAFHIQNDKKYAFVPFRE